MKRLRMLVEGPTEAKFVRDVLAPYLAGKGLLVEPPTIVCTSRDKRTGRKFTGGVRRKGWQRVRDEMLKLMRGDADANCLFSTMFDFYGFPEDIPHDPFTGDHAKDVEILEKAFCEDVERELASHVDVVRHRLIPLVMLHEFETFIFVDPQAMDWEYIEAFDQAGIDNLKVELVECGGLPENVNNGETTAPSKRILQQFRSYDKVTKGNSIVAHIGIARILKACPHFSGWVDKIIAAAQ